MVNYVGAAPLMAVTVLNEKISRNIIKIYFQSNANLTLSIIQNGNKNNLLGKYIAYNVKIRELDFPSPQQ
jgi:hypothetical protein